jgi:hypothetical protein
VIDGQVHEAAVKKGPLQLTSHVLGLSTLSAIALPRTVKKWAPVNFSLVVIIAKDLVDRI